MSYFSIQILWPVQGTAQEIQIFKAPPREQLDCKVLDKVKKFGSPCFLVMVLLLCVDRDLLGTDFFMACLAEYCCVELYVMYHFA
jgi:hypothetical protein